MVKLVYLRLELHVMVIGHEKILAFFDRAMAEGVLAQAYCFVGPDQIGKRTVANAIAAKLLNKEVDKLISHPDYAYFEREIDQKTGKRKKDLNSAQAREIRHRLERRSWLHGYQVVVVNDVELLNDEAANALLKTLEEPPEKSVIFLLTENDQVLLSTIKSRCQLVHFSPVANDAIKQGLEGLDVDSLVTESALRVAQGLPGKAINFALDEEVRATYYAERERFEKMIGQTLHGKLELLDDVLEEKEVEGGLRERVEGLFDLWSLFCREIMLHKAGLAQFQPTAGSGYSTPELITILETLCQAKKQVRQNGNTRLIVEQVILSL